jgi:hypothetical protein
VLAVRPDGFALRLNDVIVRARFRSGRAGEDLLPPKFDVNRQTGGPIGREVTGIIADQTVYHDRTHASWVDLPIVKSPLQSRRVP